MACTIAGAIFAAVDQAMAAFGEPRCRAAREGDGPNARAAARYLEREDVIEIRLLTGRILCLVGTVLLTYNLVAHHAGLWARLSAVALAALFYAIGVGVATTLSARRASRLALPLLRYARPLELFVAPMAAPLVWASRLIDKLFPPRPEDDPERVTEVEFEQLIEQAEELGSIDEDNAEMLKSVLEFGETVAREIMVPRTSMVSIDLATPLLDVLELINARGHSRYPVYRESIDNPEGILYAKDLFRLVGAGGIGEGSLAQLIRRPLFFTAESQKISELLRQMQARRVHLAIVVDEYGGTSGMVTLEDIIEEIVGEIRDEHDFEESPIQEIGPGRFLANAEVSVHDLAEVTGLSVPVDGAYESLGGMVIELAGGVPEMGHSIGLGDHDLIVRAADERHVTRVEVVSRGGDADAAE